MTSKKKRALPIVLGIVGLLVLAVAVAVVLNLPKEQPVSNKAYNLAQLSDGRYRGRCDNGLVKAEVEVEVKDHTIVHIDILAHENGLGAPAEPIVETVVAKQSLELDAVAGATYSSNTILKAVEDALSKGQLVE